MSRLSVRGISIVEMQPVSPTVTLVVGRVLAGFREHLLVFRVHLQVVEHPQVVEQRGVAEHWVVAEQRAVVLVVLLAPSLLVRWVLELGFLLGKTTIRRAQETDALLQLELKPPEYSLGAFLLVSSASLSIFFGV